MKNWDIKKLLPLLRECGEIALKYYEHPPIEVKADKSIVTAADKSIEARLALEFDHPEDDIYFIGEETVNTRSESYLRKALTRKAWVIDPIDGTAPYALHLPTWGISIALMENGVITEGAIYLPVPDECLLTDGRRVLHCSGLRHNGRLELFDFKMHPFSPDSTVCVAQRIAKNNIFKISNQLFSWSSCVASFYYLFTGKIMAYVTAIKLWDIAACLAILERSHFNIRYQGEAELPIRVDNNTYVLDYADPECWWLRGYIIVAGSDKAIRFIMANSNLPEL